MGDLQVLTLILPLEQSDILRTALITAGYREIGGVLMGEHVDTNEFIVRELSVHRRGSFASFLRRIEDALGQMRAFFKRTGHDYRRYNYLGEWHSHPSFAPFPSTTDDTSMLDIVQDTSVGANFVVLIIAKLGRGQELVATAHVYLPDGSRSQATLQITSQLA
jgi:integrative and conjugative element protein (TIGR02256 family)